MMSIEEVERILEETQEAVEYQRVGIAGSQGPHLPPARKCTCSPRECLVAALEGRAGPCLWWSRFLK